MEIGSCEFGCVTSLGDAAVAIGLARLKLTKYEPKVRSDLSTVLETMRIIDASYKDLSRSRPNAGNSSESDNTRIVLDKLFDFLDNTLELDG